MTEAEWLACTDSAVMLHFLRGKASDRKLRLFACACCRQIWHLLGDPRSRNAVEVAEQYADRLVTRETLRTARTNAGFIVNELWEMAGAHDMMLGAIDDATTSAACFVAAPDARKAAKDTADAVEGIDFAAGMASAFLLRDIFGNPFRSLRIDRHWLAPPVTGLAQAIYEERRFCDLPVLADALEEAGCTNADLLNHCRQPGLHTRGCWPVDLILQKS
jgi:hypothetical protein